MSIADSKTGHVDVRRVSLVSSYAILLVHTFRKVSRIYCFKIPGAIRLYVWGVSSFGVLARLLLYQHG